MVRVDRLGPVIGPRVGLDDGSEPHGIIWSVTEEAVATIDGEEVIAVGPGEARVVGEWEDQRIEWRLLVELATRLSFVDAPAILRIDEVIALKVEARRGEEPIHAGEVQWDSSDPQVLRIDGGRVRGRSPGMAYVTARARGAQAVIEIEVR